jgi:phosphodiesterase/alkaline phosphatase D-like protein
MHAQGEDLMRFAWLALLAASCAGARPGADSARITHGPILGRLGAREIGIWVRTSQPGPFSVAYGKASDPLHAAAATGETRLENDRTGWIHLKDLLPDTRYWYKVRVKYAEEGIGGTFRTLPDPAALKDPELNPRGLFNFSFEFACGNNQNPRQGCGPELPAFRTMLARLKDKINFAVLNGDWLYEEVRERPPDEGVRGTPVVRHAPAIAGVWENYKLYLSRGANLSAWHREIPSFFTFDDHEILNDVWGAGSPGLRDRRAVFRDIGVQAWYDYLGWANPVSFTQGIRFGRARLEAGSDVLSDPEADFTSLDLAQAATLHVHWGGPTAGVNDNALDGVGGDPNAGVYEIVQVLGKDRLRVRPAAKQAGQASYSIGRRSYYRLRVANGELLMLDTRSHREMHDTKNPGKPGLSMLGKAQKEWLKSAMAASDADFFFVFSSVNFMVPHVGGGAVRGENKDDAWTVFLDEREELIRFWDGLGKPVFVLTGDLHNSFAIRITDRVWEFASGPHNSQNHILGDEGNRPANGPFDSQGRKCEIRWSSSYRNDIPRDELRHPLYCVVQVNNVFNNPLQMGQTRWVAFPRPQVIFQYYDGRTGELRYAESVVAGN